MALGSVKLRPGVSVDWTPTLNEAGISQSQLIRFRDSLAQKYGGWQKFFPLSLSGIVRDLHAWEDLNSTAHLSVGTTNSFGVITDGAYQNITPQQLVSNFSPNFSTINGQNVVTVNDSNIANVTTFDSVFFNTPVSVGGIILAGLYPINEVTGTTTYKIIAAMDATSTVNNGGAVPEFTITNTSSVVEVTFPANGTSVGSNAVFQIPTTIGNLTVSGSYSVASIVDANDFDIQTNTVATSSASAFMNGGDAQLVYYITLGPPAAGVGYGLGTYGAGGYGTGVVPSAQAGTPISPSDWTSDNWGQLSVAVPADGAIYYWDPTGGFTNMNLVSSGPPFNSGMFVSTSEQIMVTYGSSVDESQNSPAGFGIIRDPMLVQWSDSGDFISATAWTPLPSNFAGNFRIPIGSEIRAGLAGSANQNLIWTDLDLWAMNFVGQPDVFGFNQIGAGMGACGRHAVQRFRGSLYWMGTGNFYQYNGGGASVLPCSVWDAVFQNINPDFFQNVRAMPNTPFNEIGWLYPSFASSSGECDSYVKMNVTEPGNPWDYGSLPRSAWIDQSVLGNPIAGTSAGIIYQHETTNDADGQPLVASFTTGYFDIGDGEQIAQVDQVIPDFKWQTFAGATTSANITLTFNVVDFPGQTPRQYGPYTVTVNTKYLITRFRGRQMSITVQSADLGSFWRLGNVRYRYRPTGFGGTFA